MTWVVFVLIFSVVVGKLRGGRIKALTDVHTTAWWLLLVGLVMQVVANFLPVEQSSVATGLLLLSYVPILIMIWINRNDPGMWIAGIGILMNSTVIAINRGMPVLAASVEISGGSPNAIPGGKHVLLDATTRLPFLGDIIPLPGSVISLGDVFLAIGLGVFIEEMMRKKPRLFRRGVIGESGSATKH